MTEFIILACLSLANGVLIYWLLYFKLVVAPRRWAQEEAREREIRILQAEIDALALVALPDLKLLNWHAEKEARRKLLKERY